MDLFWHVLILLLGSTKSVHHPWCSGVPSASLGLNCSSNDGYITSNSCSNIPPQYNGANITQLANNSYQFNCNQTFSLNITYDCSGYGVLNSIEYDGFADPQNWNYINGSNKCINVPVTSNCIYYISDGYCPSNYGMVYGYTLLNNTDIFNNGASYCCLIDNSQTTTATTPAATTTATTPSTTTTTTSFTIPSGFTLPSSFTIPTSFPTGSAVRADIGVFLTMILIMLL
jgi:hypothetical protein